MKVTIDNLVGNAGRIQSQRVSSEKSRKDSVKSDTAEFASKIDSRVTALQDDLKNAQTELSKNQIIKEGISKAVEDLANGKNPSSSINAVTFNDKKVLFDYLGESEPSQQTLFEKGNSISDLIKENVKKLTRLQVEAENIQASNLSGRDIDTALKQSLESTKLSDAFARGALNADAVSRLIR